ncbi:MAG: MFS transporter [Varibaculum cambriense]|uniref:MFS transporter n=1 Tax=Varibaculum cambriense TaxID=184870 RepID=UPI0029118D82|nr:MFS transporter [Varibaculum cambriense]MDU6680375.1 MFS transporter [Varibaculum cambriense]
MSTELNPSNTARTAQTKETSAADKGKGAAATADFTAPKRWKLVLVLYLAGIGMGALDMGIVNPARTVIQNGLGVDDKVGVWVFTIYTLAYAAAIPVIGKIADIIGRKPVYVLAIGLFGLGSLGCGLSQDFSSLGLLLASRAIQAIGGGGMVPVATAAVGTIVPPPKRGMALGLVGMVYGAASVFGASAGSLVLDIAGQENWQWIFYINVPIAIIVVLLGIWALPQEPQSSTRKLDLPGIFILVVMITALLWAFQNLDFTKISESLSDRDVWGGLLIFLVLIPAFWIAEVRAEDPIIDFKYFATINVGTTLMFGAVSGILMMTVMFIPQFAENCLRLPSGAGGYPTIIIGVASAIGAPLSGRLTDRFGPRAVLGVGVLISTIAGFMLIYWASPYPGLVSNSVSIFVMGLGLGFLMGAPLTYLILHLIPETDANSGQATLSLIRSLGTTLAPAILVGLLATAMGGLSGKVMDAMPAMEMPAMTAEVPAADGKIPAGMPPQAQGQKEAMPPQEQAKNQTMPSNVQANTPEKKTSPKAAAPQTKADRGFKMSDMPASLQNKIKTADVTNVVDRSKDIANYIFDQQEAKMKAKMGTVPPGVEQMRAKYLKDIESHRDQIETAFQLGLNEGFTRLFWFYTILSLAGILLLAGLPSKRKIDAIINPDPDLGLAR